MNLDRVGSGQNLPSDINVIIEIPSHSDPVKYEVDKETGALFVDRFMNTAMFYPCNYGYVPNTLSDDGDPADVLVISPYALISGCVVQCRPVGMLKMTDESGEDAKIIAVPHDKMYDDIKDIADVPERLLSQLGHFFEHYKDLDKNKWVKVEGWVGKAEAEAELIASVERFNEKAAQKN
ncbi:MAG TPA: inorganic diphosphatase [Methylophaga aminisulfidivorans]|uniref:Inorganic pyrophosphatase n=2 Tax=root TaxID=1 RepID=A0A7C1ZNX3_9GAMM|nr:inorganic diphosphatase [Methylophaga aminisulfidivorans]